MYYVFLSTKELFQGYSVLLLDGSDGCLYFKDKYKFMIYFVMRIYVFLIIYYFGLVWDSFFRIFMGFT